MPAKNRKLALEPDYPVPTAVEETLSKIKLTPARALYLLKQLHGLNPKTKTFFTPWFDVPTSKVKDGPVFLEFKIWREGFRYKAQDLIHIWDMAHEILISRTRCTEVSVLLRSHNRAKPSSNRKLKKDLLLTDKHMIIIAGAVCTFDHTLLLPLLCPPEIEWLVFDGVKEGWFTGKELAVKWDYTVTSIPLVRAVKHKGRVIPLNTNPECYTPHHPLFDEFKQEGEECVKFGEYGRFERLPCMDGLL